MLRLVSLENELKNAALCDYVVHTDREDVGGADTFNLFCSLKIRIEQPKCKDRKHHTKDCKSNITKHQRDRNQSREEASNNIKHNMHRNRVPDSMSPAAHPAKEQSHGKCINALY